MPYVDRLAEVVFPRRTDYADRCRREDDARLLREASTDQSLAASLHEKVVLQQLLAQWSGYTPTAWVVERELAEIAVRRTSLNQDALPPEDGSNPLDRAWRGELVGLCLSGGGIRSATFNLGVLQGLAQLGLLKQFDYLSSVSGGGYIHEWLAAWIRRTADQARSDQGAPARAFADVERQLIPATEAPAPPGTQRLHEPHEVRWLRRYSNYLTPRVSLFAADAWVTFTTWARNTVLNQVVLVASLFFVMLLPQVLTQPPLVVSPDARTWSWLQPITLWLGGGVLVASVLLAAIRVGRALGTIDAPDATTLDDVGVERHLVLPAVVSVVLMVIWRQLLVLAPTAIIGTGVFATGAIAGVCVAVGGRALRAYVVTNFNSVDEWHTARAEDPFTVGIRFAAAAIGIGLAIVVAAATGAAWAIYVPDMLTAAVLRAVSTHAPAALQARVAMVVDPAMLLMTPAVGLVVLVGLFGRTFRDGEREWLARLTAWATMSAAAWVAFAGAALLGQAIVDGLARSTTWVGLPTIASWIGLSWGGVAAGKSGTTRGASPSKTPQPGAWPLEWLAIAGPYVFIAGLFIVVGWAADLAMARAWASGPLAIAGLLGAPVLVALVVGWRVDINEFSMHAFYRNRLVRCYLGASRGSGNAPLPRRPNPFTGLDSSDGDVALSHLRPTLGYLGPYPIFCAAINLTIGEDLAWQERKAASFAFTPIVSGYDVPWPAGAGRGMKLSGYADTERYAYHSPGIHLGTVAAISGAAVSPNAGYHSNPATAFLLTMFDVRLGWWITNPRHVRSDGGWVGQTAPSRHRARATPPFALWQLIRELLGRASDRETYVYLSDGGHFDNMGLYELVRRRCRYIVISDGEEDGGLQFDGLGMAIRKCRADFGVEVDLDLRPLARLPDSPWLGRHGVVGTIRYPGEQECGIVVYLKASLAGDEPPDVITYSREHPTFPHDSTTDQWFTESQFESYRRLGLHIARTMFEPATLSNGVPATNRQRADFFADLASVWCPPTPEVREHQAALADDCAALLSKIRTDGALSTLLPRLFNPGDGRWLESLPSAARAQAEIAATACAAELYEFMFKIYTELNLVMPPNAAHPAAQRWARTFKAWRAVDVVGAAWTTYRGSFPPPFQTYVEHL